MVEPQKISDQNIVVNKITVARLERRREDILTWQRAIQSAENIAFPRRRLLMENYQRIMLDAFLFSFVERRIQEVTNQRIIVKDQAGKRDEAYEAITRRGWFRKLLRLVMETRFYGHTLIEPSLKRGNVVGMMAIPRHHVIPELGIVMLSQGSHEGIPFRTSPLDRQLLEVGERSDLGLLHRAAPYVLYKQGLIADWANFCEIFGMPIRQYQYNPHDPVSRQEAEKAAQEMGSAAYIIVPEGVGLELHESADASGSSDLYKNFRQAMNNELAVLILGNQLTSQNEETGAFSLGEIHQDEQDKIHSDDFRYVESVLNDTAKDFLSYWGLAPKNGYEFEFDRQEHLSMAQRVDVDSKLAALVPISQAYFYDRYNVPPPTPAEAAAMKQAKREAETAKAKEQPSEPGADDDDGPAARYYMTRASYEMEATARITLTGILEAFEALIRAIFEGRAPQGGVDEALMIATANQLLEGWQTSYNLANPDYDKVIQRNIFAFAGAKTYDQVQLLRDAVYRNGKLMPFTEFRALALGIHSEYNENWLRAEYVQVKRAGTMAQKWEQISMATREYPYLQYETEGDSRVRPEHAAMDGITLPITHQFWNDFYPPNGWNCRCRVKQIRRDEINNGQVKLSDGGESMALGMKDADPYWQGNVGRQGFIFRDNHHYFRRLDAQGKARLNELVDKLTQS